jgi:uncharacterized protein (TIGR03000 family)
MKTLSKCLILSALGALFVPATAHAQFGFFGGPSYGYYSNPYGYGSPYGYGYSTNPYGYGMQYGGYPSYGGGYVTGPQYYYSGGYVPPIVYSVSTASVTAANPRIRPAAYPAIPFRATPVEGTQARIDVRVPTESAEVWFEGVLMKQTGMDRHFVTPDLESGSVYTMEIRVRWNDAGGKQQNRTERIEVRAGALQAVDFQTVR